MEGRNADFETVQIDLNGEQLSVQAGQTILQTILMRDKEFPHVCYHPALGPIETCDTCIVDVDGQLMRSCSTVVKPNMRIQTMARSARGARKEAMDRILKNHELYCTVCDNNNGNCTLHNTAMKMKIKNQSYPFERKGYDVDNSNPFFAYNADQCILCGRCVEACQNLQVSEVLSIDWTREKPRVIWDNDVSINESSCVSCGHCVTVCPCNALIEKSMLGEAGFLTGLKQETLRPMIDVTKKVEPGYDAIFAVSEMEAKMRESQIKKTKTVCTFCGVGCSFDIWTKGRKILKVEPQMEAPANQISTCVKGKFGYDFVNSTDRIVQPLIRKDGQFTAVSWEDALNYIANRLQKIYEQHGADSIGYISSSKCTNEENYLMQKLARAVMNTNNIDNCSRYCQSPATFALRKTMGYGGDTGSISDLAQADLVMIVGANPAESHPVLSTRIRRAQKKFGQKLIVADLRKNGMAERADVWIHPSPGTDLVWLSALTKYIIDESWHDERFIRNRVNGFVEYYETLKPYTLEYAEQVTGISQTQIVEIAKMIKAAEKVCICWAMGVTQHVNGSNTSAAICNLLLVTGQVGRPGTGGYPLRGHNNVQGAGDFGCAPDLMPGYESVYDEKVRAKYQLGWGTALPSTPGLDNHGMVEAIHSGNLKAMYIVGEDMALVDANANYVQQAFTKLDFLVVQDIFFSKTAEYADVILPGCPSLEKEGTFTNTERRIQRLYQALNPLGDAKPDWRIIQDLANRLGANWHYEYPGEIMAEAAGLADFFAGVTYERLEGYKTLQWPVKADGTDSPLLYQDGFLFPDGKARLFNVKWVPPILANTPPQYDLVLNNGRILEHFHEGNLTYRVKGLSEKVPECYVEVSPELAVERGIQEGSLVRLVSPYGAVKLRAVITNRVIGKELYMPMNSAKNGEAINYLTSNHHDEYTDTPAYKEVAVYMEVLKKEGKSPLRRGNFRLGHSNPLPGVMVERKWARADYQPLVTRPSVKTQ